MAESRSAAPCEIGCDRDVGGDGEDPVQTGQLKYRLQLGGHLAEHEPTARGCEGLVQRDEGAEAAAVDLIETAETQDHPELAAVGEIDDGVLEGRGGERIQLRAGRADQDATVERVDFGVGAHAMKPYQTSEACPYRSACLMGECGLVRPWLTCTLAGMNGSIPASDPAPMEWACTHLPRDLAAVEPALGRLRTWLQGRGVEAGPALDATLLATTEALTNAVRHGGGPREAVVRLAWSWREGDLEIEVSEPGNFAPTEDWRRLPADPLREGGRGGFLISQLMDAVEHRNHDGRHALVLRKRLAVGPGVASTASEAELTAMTEELANAYETIAALFHFAGSLATAPGLKELADRSFERLRPLIAANAAWVRLLAGDGTLRLLAVAGENGLPDTLPAQSATIETAVAQSAREQTLARRSELAATDPLRAGSGCAFICPFSFQGQLRGVVTVTRADDAGGFFTAGQIGLVRTLAEFLGIACGSSDLQTQRQQAEKSERQLEFAQHVQRGLLPERIASHPVWRVYGVCAQAAEVGGDFFDVIDLADGRRVAVIADVMGKGMSAALLAATLRSALRAHAPAASDPAALLNRVNRQLAGDLQHLEMFITAQVVELAARGGALAYASAGHCPILQVEPGQAPQWWEEGGLPLGVDANETYEARAMPVSRRACVLLMTDGVLEHEDEAGRELGREGLLALIGTCASGGDPAKAGPGLLAALKERSAGRPPRDDCTLVAIGQRPEVAS